MRLGQINSPIEFDPWTLEQFQGFTGMPWASAAAQDQSAATVAAAQFAMDNAASAADAVSGDANADKGVIQVNGGLVNVNGGGNGNVVGTSGNGGNGAVLPNFPTLPRATTANMPTITATANAIVSAGINTNSIPAPITPNWLTERLPNIVNSTPMQKPSPCASGIGGWVAQNPTLAALGLVGLVFLFWKGKD